MSFTPSSIYQFLISILYPKFLKFPGLETGGLLHKLEKISQLTNVNLNNSIKCKFNSINEELTFLTFSLTHPDGKTNTRGGKKN